MTRSPQQQRREVIHRSSLSSPLSAEACSGTLGMGSTRHYCQKKKKKKKRKRETPSKSTLLRMFYPYFDVHTKQHWRASPAAPSRPHLRMAHKSVTGASIFFVSSQTQRHTMVLLFLENPELRAVAQTRAVWQNCSLAALVKRPTKCL